MTAARDRGTLRGAVQLRNRTGHELTHARVTVDDQLLPGSKAELAAQLADKRADVRATTSALGIVDLPLGDVRVALPTTPSRPLREVLVYDPIDDRLDHPGDDAVIARELSGTVPPASPAVVESLELALDDHATAGLPLGGALLVTTDATGALVVVSKTHVFDDGVHARPTFPIGTASGVTGHRERREITYDETKRFDDKPEHRDKHRLVEEFAITIDNARDEAVEVIVREHLYRGQTWNVVYYSTATVPEGSQQIAMRTSVPAHGHSVVSYVVTYPW